MKNALRVPIVCECGFSTLDARAAVDHLKEKHPLEWFRDYACYAPDLDSCRPCPFSGGPSRVGGGLKCRHPQHPSNNHQEP
jgi:hypothetical protein